MRIGEGAGYAGAWIEPAVELIEKGDLDYLCFEGLAERTIALAQLERSRDPSNGFSPMLERRMRAVLPRAVERGVPIVTNMGAANPHGAAAMVLKVAHESGLRNVRVAVVEGDDVKATVLSGEYRFLETGRPVTELARDIVSANAYIGAEPLLCGLRAGANVVIAGRTGDASLHLSCLQHAYDWPADDWNLAGAGTLVGHLLECSAQITGGYFADPGYKDVEGLGHVGYPIAEVGSGGECVITKVAGSGGIVNERTCKEQVLYELHDPASYLTPDTVADFSGVSCAQAGPDRVRVAGAKGRKRPDTLKVSVGIRRGYIADGQISYGGSGALARAQLAAGIMRERMDVVGIRPQELRIDFIGVDSLFPSTSSSEPSEVRLRIAARVETFAEAEQIVDDVEALWVVGPAGGGGATKSIRPIVQILSTLVPREIVEAQITVTEILQ